MRKKSVSIGGQAVIEGVMMRGERSMATACRTESGDITVESRYIKPVKEKNVLFRIPVIRGVLNFLSSMVSGVKTLMRSGEVFGEEEGEPSKFEKWLAKTFKIDIYSVVMFISVILGVVLAVGLFVFLPLLIRRGIESLIPEALAGSVGVIVGMNFAEGIIRLIIFVLYIALTSLMKDIRRTYMYHGAEHKTINAYEHDLPLTVENVQKMTTVHDRCGTTFMVLIMVIGVLVLTVCDLNLIFSLSDNWAPKPLQFLADFGWRLLLMFPIMGISYELLKLMAKFDNVLVRVIKAPGLLLQKLTTRQPDDAMVEVAIKAFNTVLAMDADSTVPELTFDTNMLMKKAMEDLSGLVKEESDLDWMICHVTGLKRSQIKSQTYIKRSQFERLKDIAVRRASGEPLWQIIGSCNFYGYDIDIDATVLCPRPETEELVCESLKRIGGGARILDMCTGSGCIAVAAASLTDATVVAADISADALKVARGNIDKFNLGDRVELVQSDMFASIEGKYDLIVCNPPYIPSGDIAGLEREVKDHEPLKALDGGEDGLDYYRILAMDASAYLDNAGYLALEVGAGQAGAVKEMLAASYDVEIIKDMQGVERIVMARLKAKEQQ